MSTFSAVSTTPKRNDADDGVDNSFCHVCMLRGWRSVGADTYVHEAVGADAAVASELSSGRSAAGW